MASVFQEMLKGLRGRKQLPVAFDHSLYRKAYRGSVQGWNLEVGPREAEELAGHYRRTDMATGVMRGLGQLRIPGLTDFAKAWSAVGRIRPSLWVWKPPRLAMPRKAIPVDGPGRSLTRREARHHVRAGLPPGYMMRPPRRATPPAGGGGKLSASWHRRAGKIAPPWAITRLPGAGRGPLAPPAGPRSGPRPGGGRAPSGLDLGSLFGRPPRRRMRDMVQPDIRGGRPFLRATARAGKPAMLTPPAARPGKARPGKIPIHEHVQKDIRGRRSFWRTRPPAFTDPSFGPTSVQRAEAHRSPLRLPNQKGPGRGGGPTGPRAERDAAQPRARGGQGPDEAPRPSGYERPAAAPDLAAAAAALGSAGGPQGAAGMSDAYWLSLGALGRSLR